MDARSRSYADALARLKAPSEMCYGANTANVLVASAIGKQTQPGPEGDILKMGILV